MNKRILKIPNQSKFDIKNAFHALNYILLLFKEHFFFPNASTILDMFHLLKCKGSLSKCC